MSPLLVVEDMEDVHKFGKDTESTSLELRIWDWSRRSGVLQVLQNTLKPGFDVVFTRRQMLKSSPKTKKASTDEAIFLIAIACL